MTKSVNKIKFITICIISNLTVNAQSAGVTKLKVIKIVSGIEPYNVYSVSPFKAKEGTVNIKVEDDSDQFDIKIELTDPSVKIKIEQRYETSIVVNDEGPHLDLVNWKHYLSDWVELPPNTQDVYKSNKISEQDSQRFPKVRLAEVIAVIREKGGNHWYEVAKDASNVNVAPIFVKVSKISFRFSEFINNCWTPVYTLDCHIPLGD